jgi:hypothetical protein
MTTLFYPLAKDRIDGSQIEKGNPHMTDFLSWLISVVGVGNYHFDGEQDVIKQNGWYIRFDKVSDAILFKLTWL